MIRFGRQNNLGDVCRREMYEKAQWKRAFRKMYKKAVHWYTKSAEQGDAEAQYHLGVMYKNGRGVPQDHEKAIKWFTKSAEQG